MVAAFNSGIEYIYWTAGLDEENSVLPGITAQPQPIRYCRSDKLVYFNVKRKITQQLLVTFINQLMHLINKAVDYKICVV